ncbi:adenylyl-sulfate kinase [Petrachloros mirabilis]
MSKGIKGFTIWLTGLSGAGKSTLATCLAGALREREIQVELMDGDQFRSHLSKGLGFSKEDRDTNVRRIGHVCQLLNQHGIVAVVAAIAPYHDTRKEVREMCHGRFVEVYLSCPLDILIQRDKKGLYKRAMSGELKLFTGVSDPYEIPIHPEVVLHTDKETPLESLGKIISRLNDLGYVK